jgi:hypothetical protein
VDKPQIRLLARPLRSTKAIIFIHGGWSQNWGSKDKDYQILLRALRQAGWEDAIYHLWWDSSECFERNFHKVGTIGERAKRVGKQYFSNLVASGIPEQEVSILAYSFGARVAYYALNSWSGQHNLKDAILLAGAIKRDSSKDWGYAASKLSGRLFNIYNNDDLTLDWFHQVHQGGTSPCGRKPIQERHPKIVNLDATYSIGRHHGLSSYLERLSSFWNVRV